MAEIMKNITGKLLKLGDNIDTFQIVPKQYRAAGSATKMAKHLLEKYANGFAGKIERGAVLVAGSHFGDGPATQQAAQALKAAKISCVIAKSFGRTFFRHAINHGLLLITADIFDNVNDGDNITIDPEQGKLTYEGGETSFPPYPEFVRDIIQKRDLIDAVKKRLGKK